MVAMNSVSPSWLTSGPSTKRSISQADSAMTSAAKASARSMAPQNGSPCATMKSSERTSARPASSTMAPCAKLNTPEALKIRTKPNATSEYSTPASRPPISTSMNWPNAITAMSPVAQHKRRPDPLSPLAGRGLG